MAITGNMEKANSRPIDGPYPELAREVRRLLGHTPEGGRPYLSSRDAARVTGVNHATITTTVRGDRPSEGTILKLAKGLDGDAGLMLALAGYPVGRYLREGVSSLPRSEQVQVRREAYVAEERAIRTLADVRRFGIGPDFSGFLDPGAGFPYTATIGNWEAYVLPVLAPLLPYMTRGRYALIAEDYLRALDDGDGEARQLERSFRDLLLDCISLTKVYMATGSHKAGDRSLGPSHKQQAELDQAGRRNRLALAAWYEKRHDSDRRLPGLSDLIGLLSFPPEDCHHRVGELFGPNIGQELPQIGGWYRLLREMDEIWPSPGIARTAQTWLQLAVEDAEPHAHLLGLAYLGLLIAIGLEQAYSRAFALRSVPGTAPFAHALTLCLITWWRSTGSHPALREESP